MKRTGAGSAGNSRYRLPASLCGGDSLLDGLGGDTGEAELTGFKRDAFNNLFARAVRSTLNERGMTEVNSDSPTPRRDADIIIRYTLRERLVITILDEDTRRLIWRGEAANKFDPEDLRQETIDTTVREILSEFQR